MKTILRGYEPKNKRLTRLKNKAWLQLVLNQTITSDVTEAIRDVISCKYCKYYGKELKIFDDTIRGCSKVGGKERKYALLITKPASKDKLVPVMQLLYCCQFEEIPED